jgi:putative endonuclease
MIECCDKTFYIGTTNNVKKRIEQHNKNKGAKYTRGRTPVEVKFTLEFKSRSEACKEECRLKQYSKIEKLKLIDCLKNEKAH